MFTVNQDLAEYGSSQSLLFVERHIIELPGDGVREVANPREELIAFGNVVVLVFETTDIRFEFVDAIHDLGCSLFELFFVEKGRLETPSSNR